MARLAERARQALALAALLALLAGQASAAADERAGELERLRRAIEEQRERVVAYEREERGLLETVERMDRASEALGDDAARARDEARQARASLAELEAETGRLEAKLAGTKRALSARAVALYKDGQLGPLRALFAAQSLPEALARVEVLRRLLSHDQELLERFREEVQALAGARTQALALAEQRDAAAARLERRERELARERESRRTLLARVRADRSRGRGALVELENAAHALEETLANLREAPPRGSPVPGATPLPALRGALPPPVDAPIEGEFGRVVDAEFGTQTVRKGVDFAAPAGAPVRAVAAGEVRFTGWFRGYGKIVILDHGDAYFTVHGHLDRIDVAVGERAAAGQQLGSVGETGSLRGPMLYFELRRGGEALDPGEWLRLGSGG